MIKLEDDDEAFEASTKSCSSSDISNKRRNGDTTDDGTPKEQQGGSWHWLLPEDGIESQYRHLDFIPDGSEDCINWETDSPYFFVPSNEEREINEDHNHHETTLSHIDTEDFHQIPDANNTIDTATTIGNRTIKDDQSPAATAASKDKSSSTSTATSNDRERTSIPGKSSPATIDTTATKATTNWRVVYQRLLTYKKKYGTTRVPKRFKADPQLGIWVQTQRHSCKKKDRIDLLNDIGFIWNANGMHLYSQSYPLSSKSADPALDVVLSSEN